MRFALIGRPNCGKSTLFNQVAGYKAETGNFHSTTVTFTESKVRVAGEVVEIVDLSGTYTLAGSNPAEAVDKDYLASNEVDVIINVANGSHLAVLQYFNLAKIFNWVAFPFTWLLGLPIETGVPLILEFYERNSPW